MKLTLAMDTATSLGSAALSRGGELLGEVLIGSRVRHAEGLLPAVMFLLENTGFTFDDLGVVVVGAGPGSFTGVRIAAATAKGLCHALGLPLFAPSSLAAAAYDAARDGRPVCALFDARREEVYAGCWRFGAGTAATLLEPRVAPLTEILRATAPFEPVFAGEGAIRYAARLPADTATAPAWLGIPRASALLRLHALDPTLAAVADPGAWEPGYLRPSGAERSAG